MSIREYTTPTTRIYASDSGMRLEINCYMLTARITGRNGVNVTITNNNLAELSDSAKHIFNYLEGQIK